MLVIMNPDASEAEIGGVVRAIESLGLEPHLIPGTRTAIGMAGNTALLDRSRFETLPGVAEAIRLSKPFRLTSLAEKRGRTVVNVAGAKIGGGSFAIIAGPCSIEDRAKAFAIAEAVKKNGAQFFRGGAFKPRTSPYSFCGLGEAGLKILGEVGQQFGLGIVTEALDEANVALVEQYADVIQVGSRNMQNFSLLRRVGRSKLPVLLKRGMAATIEEWLLAAEYIMAEGNPNVVLCERGVRTFTQHTRNTLDLAAVPAVRRISHLPVIVDASHGTGRNYMVAPLARAGAAVGADGLMVEVHCKPAEALSDGAQALTLDQFAKLAEEVRAIHHIISPNGSWSG